MLPHEWKPTWMRLRALGSSRAIKSSYLWFFAVPLAARFCEQFPKILPVSILGTSIDVTLRLPFRWTMLFGMSACFAAGELLYLMFCPLAVRAYGSFTDFRKLHAGNRLIEAWSADLPKGYGLSCHGAGKMNSEYNAVDEARASDLFDVCLAHYSLKRPWMAHLSAFFFLAGIAFGFVLVCQSIRSVLEMSGVIAASD